jgi:hypothetical protein
MVRGRCELFKESIDEYRSRFDSKTSDFANGLLRKLSLKCNVSFEEDAPADDYGIGIYDFDSLEGHEFEYWCANLLRQNGFVDVEVTQGSGDQGVDIIARKR